MKDSGPARSDNRQRGGKIADLHIGRRLINLGSLFAGQTVEIREGGDRIWLVSFLEYDPGYFDKERDRVEPGRSPFMPDIVLTMRPEQDVNHVTG